MRRLLLALVLTAGLALPCSIVRADPLDDAIEAAGKSAAAQFQEMSKDPGVAQLSREERMKRRTEIINAALKDVNVGEASAAQLARLVEVVPGVAMSEKGAAVSERPTTLSADQGVDGLVACEGLLQLAMGGSNYSLVMKAGENFVKHPALKDAIGAGKGVNGLVALTSLDDLLRNHKDRLYPLGEALPSTLSDVQVQRLAGLFSSLVDNTPPEDKALREPLRQKLLAVAAANKAKLDAGDPKNKRAIMALDRTLKGLDSRLARGELIGSEAPELHFAWASDDLELDDATVPSKLSDLKGKVVVVDFWATWCGPCVASFPHVRDLVERYKGYPVVVLGVTSLQGRHVHWKDGKPSGTETLKDQPDKEHALMPQFMKDLDMTWPVVFSQEEVFNPEYGVTGIPHMAIIDAAGKVRYRGMHPGGTPMTEKAAKIDGVRKEAGLKAPAAYEGGEEKK